MKTAETLNRSNDGRGCKRLTAKLRSLRCAYPFMPFSLVKSLRSFCSVLAILAVAALPAYAQVAPVATEADLTTDEDVPLSGALSATVADGHTPSYRIYSKPSYGTVTISASGAFTYTPESDFNGWDSFEFVVSDGALTSTPATVYLTIDPVNDAPIARPMKLAVPINQTVSGQLMGSDVDGDDLSYMRSAQALHGEATVTLDGRFTYKPNPGFKGSDTFAFVVSDKVLTSPPANVTIVVSADGMGFIGDLANPKLTSADFPSGPDSFAYSQPMLQGTGAVDMAVDRANRRLYVLMADALKIFDLDATVSPATLSYRESVNITGKVLALSLDGRTAYVGSTGKVTAINLYPESIFEDGKFVQKTTYGNVRIFPFSPERDVVAMGVHPAGDRLIVVIDALVKKLNITNDLLRSDVGNGIRTENLTDADLPTDFGYITQLDISADAQPEDAKHSKPAFVSPVGLKDLIYPNGVVLGLRSLAFSPDGNYALLSAVGASTPRATAYGIMPTTDEGTGGIAVLDVRPAPADKPWVQYLGFIPTTEKGEKTAELRSQIRSLGWKTVHPDLQWARAQLIGTEGAMDMPIVGAGYSGSFIAMSDEVATLEYAYRDYGYMQAYLTLYPRDMVGASSVAINHLGDFGVVTLQETNNLGLLSLSPSSALAGYTPENRPDFNIQTATGKTVNGATGSAYSWTYPQKVAFTSDDSRIYIGMAGGTPKADLTNKFGSADALMLHTERDNPSSPFKGGNPPPGYTLLGGPAQKSPRLAATLQSFDSDHDGLSDQLEAYNRWNSLKSISADWKKKLVSTDTGPITDPGKPAPVDPNTPNCLDFGYFIPSSGVGYRLNTYGMPHDTPNFATKGVVTTLERVGLAWNQRYSEHLRGVDSDLPITRPYFIVGLLSQPGGGVIKNQSKEALKYTSGTGAQVDFPYFKKNSDEPHDFVLSNDATHPTDNSIETAEGFDKENTEVLIRLLLAEPQVIKIELDPYLFELISGLKDNPRVFPHGSRDTLDNQIRRDLDNHMFVTFSEMSVEVHIDSDNNGVLDQTPNEDAAGKRPGAPGKFIPLNDGDRDSDGIPDYADGYDNVNFPGQAGLNASAKFTPMTIRIPDGLTLDLVEFRLTYSESDPAAVTRTGDAPSYQYNLPATGSYRVWTKDGDQSRKAAPIDGDAKGDFIKSNVVYPVSLLPLGADRLATVYIESVRPLATASDRDVRVELILHDAPAQSSLAQNPPPVSVHTMFAGTLSVDANRDGAIRLPGEDASDATTTDKPYRFWINDDNDAAMTYTNADQLRGIIGDLAGVVPGSGGIYEVEQDDIASPGQNQEDWRKNIPTCKRDLEDFTRLVISTQGLTDMLKNADLYMGLKWSDTGSTHPSIKLYKQYDTTGALGYVTDDYQATMQLSENAILNAKYASDDPASSSAHTVVTTDEVFVLPQGLWFGLSSDNSKRSLLLEGCTVGTGQLKIVILKRDGDSYTEIGEGPGVWMDLKEPHEFVERWSCGDGDRTDVGSLQRVDAKSGTFAAPTTDAEKDYVLYVHGYNMQELEKQRWLETTYKRLWHLGYKGRVGEFSWPCSQSAPPYDDSENHAWQSGSRLLELLNNLKGLGFRVHMLAHSQGNVVAGEALRQAGPGAQLVRTYIASQAAIPAHSYDSSVEARTDFTPSTPDVYSHYLLDGQDPPQSTTLAHTWPMTNPSYMASVKMSGAAVKYVNFWNADDYALTGNSLGHPGWMIDQVLKPTLYSTGYNLDKGFKRYDPFAMPAPIYYTFPDNRFTIFAFCVSARSKALGATPTGGVFAANQSFDLKTSLNYGTEHVYHSAQFRSSMAQRWQYWNRFLIETGLKSPQ